MEDRLNRGHYEHRDHRARHAREALDPRRIQDEHEAQTGQGNRRPVRSREGEDQVPQALVKMIAADGRQAQEIAPLAHENDDADAGSEADDHRRRNEADDGTHFRGTHQHQHGACHERGRLQARNAISGSDAGEDGDECARGSGDLDTAAAEYRDACAPDDGRVEPLLRARSRGDGEGHREGQGHDADDQAGDDVRQPVAAAKQAHATGLEQGDHRESGGASAVGSDVTGVSPQVRAPRLRP